MSPSTIGLSRYENLPFSKIDEMGAGMYKGVKITQAERHKKVTSR